MLREHATCLQNTITCNLLTKTHTYNIYFIEAVAQWLTKIFQTVSRLLNNDC